MSEVERERERQKKKKITYISVTLSMIVYVCKYKEEERENLLDTLRQVKTQSLASTDPHCSNRPLDPASNSSTRMSTRSPRLSHRRPRNHSTQSRVIGNFLALYHQEHIKLG